MKDIAAPNPPPALLVIHGAEDAMLTPQIAITLHNALLPLYQQTDNDARLRLDIIPGMTHAWAGTDQIAELRRIVAAWFKAN